MIRLATPHDAAQIASIYEPYVTDTVISFDTVAPTEQEMRVLIETVLATKPWLVYEIDGEIVGYAYASAHRPRTAYRWAVDVGIYLKQGFQRKGIGRALYTKLFEILRRQGYTCAIAGITLPNDASVGLHESMGFTLLGVYPDIGYKLGKWLDVGWYQLQFRSCEEEPEEPIAVGLIPNVQEFLASS